jgi:hypothetical protein
LSNGQQILRPHSLLSDLKYAGANFGPGRGIGTGALKSTVSRVAVVIVFDKQGANI